MPFKELRQALIAVFKEMWWLLLVVPGLIFGYMLLSSVLNDNRVTLWFSKSVISMDIGDLLLVLVIASILFSKYSTK